MITYDIFISYKRKSALMASNLYYRLVDRGYSVFFDLDEMRRDRFDEQIYSYISNAQDVFVILEEGSLDSVFEGNYSDDWFCKELIFALNKNKNIIPLLLDDFKMPSQNLLPEELKGLSLINSLPFGGLTYFDDYIDKLIEKEYIISHPRNKPIEIKPEVAKKLVFSVVACVAVLVGLLVSLYLVEKNKMDEDNFSGKETKISRLAGNKMSGEFGSGIYGDNQRLDIISHANNEGDTLACVKAAQYYLEGKYDFPQDKDKAIEYYIKAAKNGCKMAIKILDDGGVEW